MTEIEVTHYSLATRLVTYHTQSSLVLLNCQHEGLQLLPQAAQLGILASCYSQGTLLVPLLLMLMLVGWQHRLHHHIQFHNLETTKQMTEKLLRVKLIYTTNTKKGKRT